MGASYMPPVTHWCGYGNLIIIKHNDDYLSAYAHNDTMLVREQTEAAKNRYYGWHRTSSTRFAFLKFVKRGNS